MQINFTPIFMLKNIFWIKLTFVVWFLSIELVCGQIPANFPGKPLSELLERQPDEKIYLHTDRDTYSNNDTIWYKIYLLQGQTLIPENGNRNVYVELINQNDTLKIRHLHQTSNGFGKGQLCLSDFKLSAGNYELRAYTSFQRNYGDDFLYRKNIQIVAIFGQKPAFGKTDKSSANYSTKEAIVPVDLQFLPEGGHLTNNLPCICAFKSIAPGGRSIEVSGWIEDETGNWVCDFSTKHQGMGRVIIQPQPGKRYFGKLNGFPDVSVELPAATDDVQFAVRQANDSLVTVRLAKNDIPRTPEQYYLIGSANGILNFYLPVSLTDYFFQANVSAERFSPGINQITVADSLMRPVAERLIFVPKRDLLSVQVTSKGTEFGKRERVDVDLKTFCGADSLPANLSVSVVNESQAVSLEEYPQSILSYLLVRSELRGNIENPDYYFKDDSVETRKNLDLLLLCQGWRNYKWGQFGDTLPDMRFAKDFGLAVQGKLKRLFWNKGARDGKITMFLRSKEGGFYIDETLSDSLGNFRFNPAIFPDSVSVFMQGVNKNENRNTELINISTFDDAPASQFSGYQPGSEEELNTLELQRMANLRLSYDKEFHPDKYNILLDEITVTETKKQTEEEDDGHSRIYGPADNVLKVDDKALSYSDIWMYISANVPGVNYNGNSITIRGAVTFSEESSTPHFLLDGVPVEKEMLDGISLTEVDKIEVLKSAGNLAVFGMKGGNGVISVFTKRGDMGQKEVYYKGIISDILRGYANVRQFYSPVYPADNSEIPDHRATIYWNPEIVSNQKGEAHFSFFTSDDTSSVLIKVEGVSFDGKPGVGLGRIYMNREIKQ